jgi:hypothetical protein
VGSSTRLPAAAMYLSLWGFPGMLLLIRFRRSHAAKLYSLSLLAVLSFGISGCGGGSGQSGSGGTPANTYQLMVTGTFTSGATTLTHNTQLTLVVQ